MNLYFGNHQNACIHLRNYRAPWVWFSSLQTGLEGVWMWVGLDQPTDGSPSPRAL